MRRLRTVVGAGALLLVVAACGARDDQGGAGSPQLPTSAQTSPQEPSTPPVGQPARTPPAGATAVSEAQLDATVLPEGFPKSAWTQDDGRTVAVVAQEGGCGKASAEVAEQSAAQVVITLVETTPAVPQACTMDIRYPVVTVSLDAPLGDRKVVLRAEQRVR